ncbi:DUF4573 domain-containing protein [Micromonospora sp. NPDC048894]|uniref:DUF4573 domain-containing protein n=1 Tax=unclassified Micromonospora TaxID=2617518 RepID=UPI0033FC1FC8
MLHRRGTAFDRLRSPLQARPLAACRPLGPVEKFRPLGPLRPLQPLGPVETLRPLGPLQPLRPVQALGPLGPVQACRTVDPGGAVQMLRPVEALGAVNPAGPTGTAGLLPVDQPQRGSVQVRIGGGVQAVPQRPVGQRWRLHQPQHRRLRGQVVGQPGRGDPASGTRVGGGVARPPGPLTIGRHHRVVGRAVARILRVVDQGPVRPRTRRGGGLRLGAGDRHRDVQVRRAEPTSGRREGAGGLGPGWDHGALPLGPCVVDRGGGQRRPERLTGLGGRHVAALCRGDRGDPRRRRWRSRDGPVRRGVHPAPDRRNHGGRCVRTPTSARRHALVRTRGWCRGRQVGGGSRGHRLGGHRRWGDRGGGHRRRPERSGRDRHRSAGDRLGTAPPPGRYRRGRLCGPDRPQAGTGATDAGQLADLLAPAGGSPAAGHGTRGADPGAERAHQGLAAGVTGAHRSDRLPDGLGDGGRERPVDGGPARGLGDGDPQRGDRRLDLPGLGHPVGGEVCGDRLGGDRHVAAPGRRAGEHVRLGQRVEDGQRHRISRVRVRPQGGRIQLAEHLAQGHGGGVPAAGQGGVRGEDLLEAGQVPGSRQGDCGERAGLEGAGQAHRPPLGRRGLHLLQGVVVGEPLGEVVDRVVVGDRQRTARRAQQ